MQSFFDGRVRLMPGDCLEVIRSLPDCGVDSVVTDPPYALVSIQKRFGKPGSAPAKGNDAYKRASAGFMGKQWDTGETAFSVEFWAEVMRVLKPGGHVAAFSGTRTYHRLACAIEDAGFEIRDQLAWTYGTGFPKSLDVSKAIDKAEVGVVRGRTGRAGQSFKQEYERNPKEPPITDAAKQWQGWGTALKPAWEPICLARKPLIGTVAENVLRHGTGALNIDACRVGSETITQHRTAQRTWREREGRCDLPASADGSVSTTQGRHPANVVHDGSAEVVEGFPETSPSSDRPRNNGEFKSVAKGRDLPHQTHGHADAGGSAARFFYSAKADLDDRLGSKHPTVKPVDLMQWLCRLITPPGGLVLDPFAGTGTTGSAAFREGFSAILIEREAEYQADIARRMALELSGPNERLRESVKAAGRVEDAGPLFGGDADGPRGGGGADLQPLRRPKRAIGPIGLKW